MSSPPASTTASVEELLAPARLWAATAQPYLASALFALTPVAAPGLGTFGVDRFWRLYVDPDRFEAWTVEECGAVLVHEVHHVLRDHSGRAKALGIGVDDRRRFNIAGDLEINDDLAELPLPAGGCHPEQLGLSTGDLAETYYVGLERPLGSVPLWGDCGSGAHGLAGDHELGPADHGDCPPGVSEGDATLIRLSVAQELDRLKRAGQSLPPGLERWANSMLAPAVDWRRLFSAALRAGVAQTAGQVDYTYRRPSRRMGSPSLRGVVLPSLAAPLPEIAVVVDTSGSMNADDLGRALSEIAGLIRTCAIGDRQVRVLSCDAEVHTTQRVFTASDVRLYGGGGTDMAAGLGAAVALVPRPDVVVVLTDGWTPWPEDRPPVRRVVVGLIGGGPEPPTWADAVRIPLETD